MGWNFTKIFNAIRTGLGMAKVVTQDLPLPGKVGKILNAADAIEQIAEQTVGDVKVVIDKKHE